MLTADQVRLRIQRCRPHSAAPADSTRRINALCDLLEELLPDLMAQAAGRSHEDAGKRYGDTPSQYQSLLDASRHTGIMGPGLVGKD